MPLPKAIFSRDLSRLKPDYPYVYLPALGYGQTLPNYGSARGSFFDLKSNAASPTWADCFGFPAIRMTSGVNSGLSWGGSAASLGNSFGGQFNGMEVSCLMYLRTTPGTRNIVYVTAGTGTYAIRRGGSSTSLSVTGSAALGSVTFGSSVDNTLVHLIWGWTADRASGGTEVVNTYIAAANLFNGEIRFSKSTAVTGTVGTPNVIGIGETSASSTNLENVDVLSYVISSRGRDVVQASRDVSNPWHFLSPRKSQAGFVSVAPPTSHPVFRRRTRSFSQRW